MVQNSFDVHFIWPLCYTFYFGKVVWFWLFQNIGHRTLSRGCCLL